MNIYRQLEALHLGSAPPDVDADVETNQRAIEEQIRLIKADLANCRPGDSQTMLNCILRMRRLLAIERNPPIDQCVAAGFVPVLIEGLSSSDKHIQFESAWGLTNIASGTSDHTRIVVEAGALSLFIYLLSSSHDDVVDQAVWAIGNIAGDSPKFRDMVLQAGGLQAVIDLTSRSDRTPLLRNAVWTISNCCRGKPPPAHDLVAAALPVLSRCLNSSDDEILTDTCWSLSYLTDGNDQQIQSVLNTGVLQRLVALLQSRNNAVVAPALRTVGNIVTGNDEQTAFAISTGVVPTLMRLLTYPKKAVRKEATWAFSNITAGNQDQIQTVMEAGAFPLLANMVLAETFDVAKEALWAISNATSGGCDVQIRRLVEEYDVVKSLIYPIASHLVENDARVAMVILEALENILRAGQRLQAAGVQDIRHPTIAISQLLTPDVNPYAIIVEALGGLDAIEVLQQHESEDVYDKASSILVKYFEADAEPVEGAPSLRSAVQAGER